MELFDREQLVLDNALEHLKKLQDGMPVDQKMFEALVKEYSVILKQLRKIVKFSDRAAEILVSEQKSRQEKINELSSKVYFDILTGIYNREYMKEALGNVIKTLQRCGGVLLSVLMIDIDNFKKYNDTYGHVDGDACLQTVARTIKNTITRDDDFVARYGGEEFIVVLPNTDENGARKIAENILANVKERNILHEKNEAGIVTVSIGITTSKVDSTQGSTDYIKRADEALYISKQNGRDKATYLSFKEE